MLVALFVLTVAALAVAVAITVAEVRFSRLRKGDLRLAAAVASAARVEVRFAHPNVIPRGGMSQASFFGDANVSVFDASGVLLESFTLAGAHVCAPVDSPLPGRAPASVEFRSGAALPARILQVA